MTQALEEAVDTMENAVGGGCSHARLKNPAQIAAYLGPFLTARQHTQFVEHGYVDVPSGSHQSLCYRIAWDDVYVTVLEAGHEVARLQALPAGTLPPADVLSFYLTMISGNEQAFLAIAHE